MSKPSALYARLSMSKASCDRWLGSPIKFVSDYDDWPAMNPAAASSYNCWGDTFPRPDYMSVREYLDMLAESSVDYCYEYDDNMGAFIVADAEHHSETLRIATFIAALRGAENFKDDDGPSYIFAFPAISGGDPDALLQIKKGSSCFLNYATDDPDVLYFIEEAEDFIEALLDDEDI